MINNFPFINVYEKNSFKSQVVTQLLYGDTFKEIKVLRSWIKIKSDTDGYIGYIKNKKFPKDKKNTHKIFVLSANLYSEPNIKYKIKKKLSYGSKIKAEKKKSSFYKCDNFWIKIKDCKKINYKEKDIFKNIKDFVNTKYKWGGKHYSGIDCSALIQLFLNNNNKFCPRDSKDQIKYFKKKVNLKNIKKYDLIFWKGHVALALSKDKLIHAYGPIKKVIIMSVHATIKKITKTANLKVIGIRRII
jgi:hypothetical protein